MFFSISVTGMSMVFLHLLVFANTTSSVSDHNENDYLALIDFKSKIISDPYGATKSWNGSVHFCTWLGIMCGRRNKRVTTINLSDKGLVGSLSPFLGNLSFLREFFLQNNTFRGNIPPEFGRLFRLQTLNLSTNSFAREIPANLSRCSNLMALDISYNTLTGKIQEELGSLLKLTVLIVRSNNLTGQIPPSLGNITTLLTIAAAENSLVGKIPESLGQLKSLKFLRCGSNQLSGIVPPSIYNISSLYGLSLAENQLRGSLPSSFGLVLPNLQRLQLRDNFFTGPIPVSLSNASELQVMELSTNFFSGKIKNDFGGMLNLYFATFLENNFGSGEVDEMSFLSSMTNCSNLKLLSLHTNQFRGVLPRDIGNFSSRLSWLSLYGNHLYGGIPSTIGNLVGLNALLLDGNQLQGMIPSSIGSLQKLELLSLNDNILSGEIPESLGNLTLVKKLYLQRNQLKGGIPPSVGNCRHLLLLDLSQNMLTEKIPKEIFLISSLAISLDLSQNHLFGSLPLEIGELVNLAALNLSENNLSGKIPETISKCRSLVNLSIAKNSFYGPIPSSFSSLRGLQIINISYNSFAGQIPLFLKDFSLQILDLSFNELEGELPMKGIFSNASIVSVYGNRGLCGGIPDLHLSKCHVSKSTRYKVKIMIILIVAAACLFIGVTWLSYFYFCSSKRRCDVSPSSPSKTSSYLKVTYGQLFKATDGFTSENLIGKGSFGSVYKGIFNGETIAVKVFNLLHRGASKSFLRECETLRDTRHRNLLKIISCCSSIDSKGDDFKALVYEFMSNGSLENWLSKNTQTEEPYIHHKLDILQRINIAIDVACALDYLHHHCERQIVHCDIKPSNVLLDRDMTARVGDFGLAKFLHVHRIVNDSSSIGVTGSIGYVAPEYGLGNEVSPNGDVYSYGIVLLEMMTGKLPTDPMFVEGLNLHQFVKMAMPDNVLKIVDPTLLNVDGVVTGTSSMEECLILIFEVGVACSVDIPQDRMNMKDVVFKLQSVKNKVHHEVTLLGKAISKKKTLLGKAKVH